MGMPIEEHIAQLKRLKSFHNGSYGASVKVAIDTMRKYQKIKQIIEDWDNDKGCALEMSELYWLDKIKEVVDNGNVD